MSKPAARLQVYFRSATIWAGIALATVWTVFPFYWAILLSFKRRGDLYSPWIIPFLQFRPTLENWRTGLAEAIGYAGQLTVVRGLTNSIIVATTASVICLLIGASAAYGLAHLSRNSRSRFSLLSAFLIPRFVAPAVLMIPVYLLARIFRVSDTDLGLVLFDVPLLLPFAVLILYDAFRRVPRDLEDAAVVDGCSPWGTLWHIVLPLIRPALFAAGILCFAFAWNEFPFALTLYQQHAATMPLVVASLETKDGIQMEYVGVNLVLALMPAVVMTILAQRYVARGLTFGAVKD
jgi:multiple sugar transport system permease protein